MARIKYDINLMKYISLFESITRAKVKDCIEDDDKLTFIVHENEIAKAIGKQGANVKKLSGILKKQLKIVEFDESIEGFIKNFIMPIKAKEVIKDNGNVTITAMDTKTRGQLLGRDRSNLNKLKDVVKRYFEIEDIKIA